MLFGSFTTAAYALECSSPVARSVVTLEIDPPRLSRTKILAPSGETVIWLGVASPSIIVFAKVSMPFAAFTCQALNSFRFSWAV